MNSVITFENKIFFVFTITVIKITGKILIFSEVIILNTESTE